MLAVGDVLSIQFTVAVVSPVLPARSSKVNVKVQLLENIYSLDHPLFVIVTHISENHVRIVITF
jgi:hypothetical protein